MIFIEIGLPIHRQASFNNSKKFAIQNFKKKSYKAVTSIKNITTSHHITTKLPPPRWTDNVARYTKLSPTTVDLQKSQQKTTNLRSRSPPQTVVYQSACWGTSHTWAPSTLAWAVTAIVPDVQRTQNMVPQLLQNSMVLNPYGMQLSELCLNMV